MILNTKYILYSIAPFTYEIKLFIVLKKGIKAGRIKIRLDMTV